MVSYGMAPVLPKLNSFSTVCSMSSSTDVTSNSMDTWSDDAADGGAGPVTPAGGCSDTVVAMLS